MSRRCSERDSTAILAAPSSRAPVDDGQRDGSRTDHQHSRVSRHLRKTKRVQSAGHRLDQRPVGEAEASRQRPRRGRRDDHVFAKPADEELPLHAIERIPGSASWADAARGHGQRGDAVARSKGLDVAAHLDDLARVLMTESTEGQVERRLPGHRDIAAANAAAADLDEQLLGARPRIRDALDGDRPTGAVEHRGAHDVRISIEVA